MLSMTAHQSSDATVDLTARRATVWKETKRMCSNFQARNINGKDYTDDTALFCTRRRHVIAGTLATE